MIPEALYIVLKPLRTFRWNNDRIDVGGHFYYREGLGGDGLPRGSPYAPSDVRFDLCTHSGGRVAHHEVFVFVFDGELQIVLVQHLLTENVFPIFFSHQLTTRMFTLRELEDQYAVAFVIGVAGIVTLIVWLSGRVLPVVVSQVTRKGSRQ